MTEVVSSPRYLVVFNPVPNKKRQRVLTHLLSVLKKRKLTFDLYPTDVNLSANQHYFRHHIHLYTDIVVLGGDGTFNVVLNCIVPLPEVENINLGLLPSGTGNDFAKRWYNGVSSEQEIVEIVLGSETQTLNLGQCEMESGDQNQTRYFHNVLGVGFDALIAKKLANKKPILKSLSYILSAIRYIPFYREPKCHLTLGNESFEYNNLITAFANSCYFGGGLPIVPNEDPKRRALTMIRAAKLPLIKKMALVIKLVFGKHLSHEGVYVSRLTECDEGYISTAGLEIEADGEFIGETPCRVSVAPYVIKLKT